MFGLGMPEILLILAVALIVIGPKKLPDLAKSLGRAIGEFRKATTDLKESLTVDTEIQEIKTSIKGQPGAATAPPGTQPPGEKVTARENPDEKTVDSDASLQHSKESDKNA